MTTAVQNRTGLTNRGLIPNRLAGHKGDFEEEVCRIEALSLSQSTEWQGKLNG